MKSSKEYYSEIYYSGVDRYFECKMRAQEYYIKKNNEKSSKGAERDSYQFSYICYDGEKGQIQGPTAFNVRLPETDYVRLLTLQLYDKEGLTYNRILFIAPDIIQAIDKQVESSFGKQDGTVNCLPYVVSFDEIIEDAKKVEETMSTDRDSSSKELKSYEFKVWIDGNYYYEDEEIEAEIMLSDDEVETIKRLVREYDSDLSCGLMPILKEGDAHLYNKFFSEIYPPVFYELFQRDEMFEPIPGDEGKKWEEEDVIYLMETYGDGYCFDDAYICYIPEDMIPPKMTLTKGMSKDEMLKYIRKWSSMRNDIYDNITCYHDIPVSEQDHYNEVIENRLLSILTKSIEENDESSLASEDFDPFEDIFPTMIANEIYEECQNNNQQKKNSTGNPKKQYTIKGKIIGTWNEHYVDIDVELTDNELEQIKAQIKKHPECDDLREIIEDDFLYVTIQEKLIQAAHEYYVQEGINDGMTREEAENVELIGNEYSCPIPEAWK